MNKTATISSCGEYRYNLTREWDEGCRQLWIMLNPSTADESIDDPTIRRLIRRAQGYKGHTIPFGSLEVVNLFAVRSSDPDYLYEHRDSIGPDNDQFIREAAERASQIVVAWGNYGSYMDRDQEVLDMLSGYELFNLGLTQEDQPRHPLYVAYEDIPS